MQTTSFYTLLKHGSAEDRQAFARTLPPSPFADQLIPLLATENRGLALVAFAGSIMSYCYGSAPDEGAILALDAHRYAVELYESDPSSGLIPTTLSGFASAYVNAANLLGKSDDVIQFTNVYIPFYTTLGELINLRSLKLARIHSLLNLRRLDEAAEDLSDPTLPGNPATDIELRRLQTRIRQLRADATEMAGAPVPPNNDDVLRDARDVIALAAEMGGGGSELAQQLLAAIGATEPLDPSQPGDFARLLATLRQGDSLLTRGQVTDSEISVRARIREASGIFVLQQQPPPSKIDEALQELTACLNWARNNNMVELQNDALWGIYLCHSRLNEPSAAADTLLALRASLEQSRAGVVDPLKRGGAFSTYPYLFAALCEKLHAAGRYPELLEAIEASKGRAVADLLTQRERRPVDDRTIYAAAGDIAELCRVHQIHYLTYFVDDDRTYSVLVSKAGVLYASPPIEITRATIRNASSKVDPATWGRLSENRRDRNPNTADVLAPLVAWLAPLLQDSVIEVDDHLCVSADDDLANVPFAYLPLADAPLIAAFTISRIHNAFHLSAVAAGQADPPRNYLGVMAPTRQDLEHDIWPSLRADMLAAIDYLDQTLPGETLVEDQASVENLLRSTLEHRIVHMSTHGFFPVLDAQLSAFESSGLALAHGNELPDQNRIARYDLNGVLTPRRLFEAKPDMTGSHVSMMACVSGLTREGVGGDALGLEWVLIQAGAASVLSTHWYVDAGHAGVFFRTFYHYWLVEKKTRAAAMRATIADMRANDETSGPRAWGAFSLTGDWR